MNNYITLTKVLLKTGLNMGSMNMKRKKNGQMKKPMNASASWILSIVICIPVALMMGLGGAAMYQGFATVDMTAAGYDMLVNFGAFMVLLLAIPYVLSVFFMSSDLVSLLPLPLTPSQILAAKFTSVLMYEYLIIGMFYAPLLIGYGIAAGGGVLFWIIVAISCLVLPVTPLVYASFLAVIMMRLLKNVKNKEMIVTIGSFLMVFVVMGVSMSVGAFSGGSAVSGEAAQMMAGLSDKMGAINKIGVIFPNNKLLAGALANDNLLWMLLYLFTVVALLGFFLFLGQKIYFSSVGGMREGAGKRQVISQEKMTSLTRQRTPKRAFLHKEIKTLFRSPEYFTNCLLMPIIFPPIMLVSMLVPMLSSMKQEGSAHIREMLAQVTTQAPAETVLPVVLIVIFALAIMIAGFNLTTTTCLSREGQGFIYMKSIPMSYRDQLESKSWCGLLIGFIASLPYVLAILIAAVVLFRVNPAIVLLGILIDFLTLAMCNYIQLWFDLFSPKLHWENEQGAVKQNYNTAIAMFAIFILGGILGVVVFSVYKVLALPMSLFLAIVLVLLAAVTLVLRSIVLSYGAKKLGRLE